MIKIEGILKVLAGIFCLLMLCWMLSSCKTVDCIPETIVKDSIRVEQRLDSIYLYEKDSIYIHQKADTIYVNKYVTRYKDVMKIERDTIWQENKVVEVKEVLVEKPIAGVVKWFSWVGAFFVVFYLVKIGLWVYRKFVLKV